MAQMQRPKSSLPVLVLSALLGAGAGAGAALTVGPRAKQRVQAQATAPAPTESALESLSNRLTQLERSLSQEAQAPGALEVQRFSEADIEAAVERILAERSLKVGEQTATGQEEAPPSADEKAAQLADALAKLNDPALSFDERTKLWGEYAKLGLMDDLVNYYEQLAANNPSNPDLQVAAGAAYLQKLFTVGSGPAAGEWAMKADGAFDKALALDEQHWDARFAKASSLAFWPPIFGKQPEAIAHFEILLKQQSGGPQKPDQVQTYLMLGNLYQQNGQLEKALSTWNQGLAAFPGNAELAKQIQLNGG